ncbi:uncharacterized protein BO95DRAFT_464060 [Aspergillus brunneoviolaceus CBS 621.78]|uniref:Uncharacterized protein n=1 Tax=Aspergillus brunneoviolaceus CBS 621.78 TaxID=1450534 RepID=A0ACD1G7U9_9EURO|nr:hypothetical protein BO95DRAFT_464060 [Aspergillus brunneoviolaceus CBS 621.78]RAH45247.1 hypothetical protein BO95DRAFT_464060 [Aspergillus brunneoviolaceus CBS 621.78]
MTLSARRINVLILTPYNAQVAKIKADLANRYHNATRKPRILTVDSSQGTEAECVIVSLSRNVNTPEFRRSKRRFNVTTSRASQSVFYLGKWSYIQSATLQQSSPTLFGMLDHYPKHVPRFLLLQPDRPAEASTSVLQELLGPLSACADEEGDIYRHHERGARHLSHMQFSVIQQYLRLHPRLYLLALLLRPDKNYRLLAFPDPARGAQEEDTFIGRTHCPTGLCDSGSRWRRSRGGSGRF